MNTLRKSLIIGAGWTAITKILINFIGIVSTFLLARILSPSDFGLVAIATSIALIFGTITELSISSALIQVKKIDESHYDTAWSLSLLRGIFLAIIVAILSSYIARTFHDARLESLIQILAISLLIGSLINPKLALFQRDLKFWPSLIIDGTEKLSGFIVSIYIAVNYQSYWALVIGTITSQAFKVFASYFIILYRPKFSLKKMKEIFSFSIWMTFGQWIQALSFRADPLIIGYFVSPQQLGLLNMGGRITYLATEEVLQPLSNVLFPAFSKISESKDRIRTAYIRIQGVLNLIAVPVSIGLAAIAEPFLAALVGEKWLDAAPIMQIIAISVIAQKSNSLNALAMGLGKTQLLFNRDLRGVLIRIPLLILGIYFAYYNGNSIVIGAISGSLLSSFINAFLNMRIVSEISDITIRDQVGIIWRPLLSSAIMAATIFFLADHGEQIAKLSGNIGFVFFLTLSGLLIYSLGIYIIWISCKRPIGPEHEIHDLAMGLIAKIRKK